MNSLIRTHRQSLGTYDSETAKLIGELSKFEGARDEAEAEIRETAREIQYNNHMIEMLKNDLRERVQKNKETIEGQWFFVDKADDFMKMVFFNLKEKNVDLKEKMTIDSKKLRRNIAEYFGYVRPNSIENMLEMLIDRGWFEADFVGFRITDKAKKEFGGIEIVEP